MNEEVFLIFYAFCFVLPKYPKRLMVPELPLSALLILSLFVNGLKSYSLSWPKPVQSLQCPSKWEPVLSHCDVGLEWKQLPFLVTLRQNGPHLQEQHRVPHRSCPHTATHGYALCCQGKMQYLDIVMALKLLVSIYFRVWFILILPLTFGMI